MLFRSPNIKMELQSKSGVDISLSNLRDPSEKEVLFRPNTEFRVDSIEESESKNFGKKRKVYTIKMTEISAGAADSSPSFFEAQAQDAWEESKHPRGQPKNAGQFGPGNGGGAQKSAKPAQRTSQTKSIEGLKEFLGMIANHQNLPKDFKTAPAQLLLDNGRPFYINENTFSGRRGTPKECYKNAALAVLDNPKLTYVEGQMAFHGVPIDHAWCVDQQGNVVDPTVKDGEDTAYFGIPISTEYLKRQLLKQKVYGILPFHSNMDLYKNGPPAHFIEKSHAPTMLDNPSGQDTLTRNTRPDGTLTPERQALHNRIIADALKGHKPVVGQAAFNLMGGGGASGKSTMQSQLGLPEDQVHVDVDIIRTKLPEWKEELDQAAAEGRKANYLLGCYTHEESSDISKKLIAAATGKNYNVLLDGAGDTSAEKVKENLKKYRANGHKIIANYATVDYDEAYRRMRSRGDKIGRYIPAAHLREVHAEVSRVFPEMVKSGQFDEFALWDTGASKDLGNGKFSPPIKVASGEKNQMSVHDKTAYDRFLAKAGGIEPRKGEI